MGISDFLTLLSLVNGFIGLYASIASKEDSESVCLWLLSCNVGELFSLPPRLTFERLLSTTATALAGARTLSGRQDAGALHACASSNLRSVRRAAQHLPHSLNVLVHTHIVHPYTYNPANHNMTWLS